MDRQCTSCGGFCKKSGCERENVQPEQEPFGWVVEHKHGGKCFSQTMAGVYTDTAVKVTAVYTPPPQRTWVGLTDEEIVAICQSVFGIDPILDGNLRKYAKAFEAKLKEKNT